MAPWLILDDFGIFKGLEVLNRHRSGLALDPHATKLQPQILAADVQHTGPRPRRTFSSKADAF